MAASSVRMVSSIVCRPALGEDGIAKCCCEGEARRYGEAELGHSNERGALPADHRSALVRGDGGRSCERIALWHGHGPLVCSGCGAVHMTTRSR